MRRVVKCSEASQTVTVLVCYGITFSEYFNTTVLGSLLLKCIPDVHVESYNKVPANVSEVNSAICGPFHREGQMCGRCQSGYAPPVYSYSLECSKCDSYEAANSLKYAAIAFLPVTLFYILVLVFKFRANSPLICEFILFCQLIGSSFQLRFDGVDLFEHKSKNSKQLTLIGLSIYGIWNLDFGRLLYKPFCLHPSLSTHQVIALDYLIAVYPLLLILLTYFLVKLHDNYRLAVTICRPFLWCTRHIQKEWNIKASLIDVFATFLLLSNMKLLNVSADLISLSLQNSKDEHVNISYIYLNGSMEYLGREHLPYFVLGGCHPCL